MNKLFYDIVKLFKWICTQTGLTYEELNILVYCMLVPLSWFLIAFLRTRKYWIVLFINILAIVLFGFYRKQFPTFSNTFYNKNIQFLELLGGKTLQGYIVVSLIIGLVSPFLMYLFLFMIRKKYLSYLIFSYLVGLCAYFGFVFWFLK